MDDSVYNKLRETGWRRKLTREEEAELRARLATHPGLQSEWEAEVALNEFLVERVDVPVPSNFTARVLQAARNSPDFGRRRSGWAWIWRSILPRAAVAGVVLLAGLAVYRQHAADERVEMARRIANISNVAALSSPEVLQDFETVRHLNQIPTADEELLALLK